MYSPYPICSFVVQLTLAGMWSSPVAVSLEPSVRSTPVRSYLRTRSSTALGVWGGFRRRDRRYYSILLHFVLIGGSLKCRFSCWDGEVWINTLVTGDCSLWWCYIVDCIVIVQVLVHPLLVYDICIDRQGLFNNSGQKLAHYHSDKHNTVCEHALYDGWST